MLRQEFRKICPIEYSWALASQPRAGNPQGKGDDGQSSPAERSCFLANGRSDIKFAMLNIATGSSHWLSGTDARNRLILQPEVGVSNSASSIWDGREVFWDSVCKVGLR